MEVRENNDIEEKLFIFISQLEDSKIKVYTFQT